MEIKAAREYQQHIEFIEVYAVSKTESERTAEINYFMEGVAVKLAKEYDMTPADVVAAHADWFAAGGRSTSKVKQVAKPGTYKVSINRKMAEEWAGRFEEGDGIPVTAGTHFMTPKEIRNLINFIRVEISQYAEFGRSEWADLIAASQRQMAKLEKVLANIG